MTAAILDADLARARAAAAAVEDPELPPLTIAELGVLRGVALDDAGRVVVRITPTYSGCPANAVIALEVDAALRRAGFEDARVDTELAPAWSTADISAAGLAKLKAMGIAPPSTSDATPACPRCDSGRTVKISPFGATACKSLWRCDACKEPFEAFKAI